MPLHHQASAYIEKVLANGQIPLTKLSLEQIRQSYRDVRHLAGEPERVARVRDLVIPGPGGNIPLRIYAGRTDDSLAVLMYFHGGGFVKGDSRFLSIRRHHGPWSRGYRFSGCGVENRIRHLN